MSNLTNLRWIFCCALTATICLSGCSKEQLDETAAVVDNLKKGAQQATKNVVEAVANDGSAIISVEGDLRFDAAYTSLTPNPG